MTSTPSTPDKFWTRLKKMDSGCWEFQGYLNSDGYGTLQYQNKMWKSHRLSYFLTTGIYPTQLILHKCDNPPCCNPDHLYEGDSRQNNIDARDRGRLNNKSGIEHHMVSYTEEQAKELVRRYKEIPQHGIRKPRGAVASLAAEFNVHVDTVRGIVKRYS